MQKQEKEMNDKSDSDKAYRFQALSAVGMILLTPVILVANLVALPFTSIYDAIKHRKKKEK